MLFFLFSQLVPRLFCFVVFVLWRVGGGGGGRVYVSSFRREVITFGLVFCQLVHRSSSQPICTILIALFYCHHSNSKFVFFFFFFFFFTIKHKLYVVNHSRHDNRNNKSQMDTPPDNMRSSSNYILNKFLYFRNIIKVV